MTDGATEKDVAPEQHLRDVETKRTSGQLQCHKYTRCVNDIRIGQVAPCLLLAYPAASSSEGGGKCGKKKIYE